MPEVTNSNLTLTESGGRVDIAVSYDVTFNEFERKLADLGLNYHTHVTVHGIDNGTILGGSIAEAEFDRHDLDGITVGNGSQTLPRQTETKTVGRAFLQEDPDAGNTDELVANIRVHSPLPEVFTDEHLTEQESMLG